MTFRTAIKWTAAIVLSLGVHVAAASLLRPAPPSVEIAGGEAMEVALLGSAFEETLQTGAVSDVIAPAVEPVEETPPVETATLPPSEAIQPMDAAEIPPEAAVSPVPAETMSEIAPQDAVPPQAADVILPAEEMPPVLAEEPEVVASLPPQAVVVPTPKPEEIAPVEPVREIRPAREAKTEKPKKKVAEKPARRKPAQTGEDGASAASQRKGAADGQVTGSAAASGRTGSKRRDAGNAVVSNYNGKVRSKVNRAFRYPTAARREGHQGTVQVQFTLAASGAILNARVVKSAGSAILDQAAVDTVQRAAPFPRFPDGVGRDRWVFTIPMVYKF
ncbi:energy transducer TonB family protein [Ensifer soli]|uniref:energy transducer TonB family protein n=1 Tax=Ciceribacter sp. sgz301302 TaxID=3342379 RepID=UPI0035BA0E46